MKRHSRSLYHRKQPDWLPVDVRILPDIFSFGHVKGVARIFLGLEIIISLLIVAGTLAKVALTLLGLK